MANIHNAGGAVVYNGEFYPAGWHCDSVGM